MVDAMQFTTALESKWMVGSCNAVAYGLAHEEKLVYKCGLMPEKLPLVEQNPIRWPSRCC